jgi:hypothetical protein
MLAHEMKRLGRIGANVVGGDGAVVLPPASVVHHDVPDAAVVLEVALQGRGRGAGADPQNEIRGENVPDALVPEEQVVVIHHEGTGAPAEAGAGQRIRQERKPRGRGQPLGGPTRLGGAGRPGDDDAALRAAHEPREERDVLLGGPPGPGGHLDEGNPPPASRGGQRVVRSEGRSLR